MARKEPAIERLLLEWEKRVTADDVLVQVRVEWLCDRTWSVWVVAHTEDGSLDVVLAESHKSDTVERNAELLLAEVTKGTR